MPRTTGPPSAVHPIRARRELHAIASLIAPTCREGELEQVLARIHPHAARAISPRELAAIAAVAARPIRDA